MLTMLQGLSTAGLLIVLMLAQKIGKIDAAILSRNKTITASSTHANWVPQKAIDGNPRRNANYCQCCAATEIFGGLNPWYELDLGQNYTVNRIHVEGRDDFKKQHFQDMQIYLKSIDGNISSGEETRITEVTYNVNYVLPEPKSTRFVSLVLYGAERAFTICELTVYGECDDGKSGNYCESVCHCDGDPCNAGVCPSGRCLPGYQGAACDMYCPHGKYGPGCKESCGNCDDTVFCHKQDGRCPGLCADGYQGKRCTQECRDGFYGQECRDECGHCQSGEPCNKVTGHCENGCAAGYQTDVTCRKECTSGTYGDGCTKQCGNCKFGATCAKTNGSCPAGCTGDYTGETCKSVCTAGFYGENCNNECGYCANETPCDPETGICRNGCSAGYQTTLCNTECNRGTYGLSCSLSCGNCRGGDFCVFTNGTCPNGCEAGYMGDACKTACVDGTYGEGCTKQCGSCANGIPCNKTNGACLACVLGYFGIECQQTETLMGNDSLLLTISGWVFGGVTVLAAIGIFVVMKIRSRRAQQKPPTNDTSLYNIPRNSRIEEDRPYDYPTVHT